MKRLIVTLTLALTLGLIIAQLRSPRDSAVAGPESAIVNSNSGSDAPAKARPRRRLKRTRVSLSRCSSLSF